MMGRALANIDAPVTKGTSGILIMRNRESVRNSASSCIKCAKCVGVCAMGLEPYLLSKLTQLKRFDDLEALRITDCIECGSCSYECPAKRQLAQSIRATKKIEAGKKAAAAAAARAKAEAEKKAAEEKK